MKLKRFIIILLSLLYFELIFGMFLYDVYLRSSIINIFLSCFLNAAIVTFIISFFSTEVRKIILLIIYGLLWIWYSLHFIFYKVFATPFSLLLFRQSDQALKFGNNVVSSIIKNGHIVVLFLVPFLVVWFIKNDNKVVKRKEYNLLVNGIMMVLASGLFLVNLLCTNRESGSIYDLYYEENNVALNIERLGIMSATYLDIKRSIFGFEEKIKTVSDPVDTESDDDLFDYDMNTLALNLDDGSTISNYVKNETGTKQNKYTGMFKGKNLVYIVAESFSEIAVSQELTPTLYKMIHEGFEFNNFYTSNNLSTIGGEFQALTGLYADNSILSIWRGGYNKYPYGLGTVFKGLGYNTYAYHNNTAYFQDRNVYLKSQGFDNFQACYTGLESKINCEIWPQSDYEMMNATVGDYINSDKPFMTYYMTVSGHFYYEHWNNAMAHKHYDLVKDLNYSEAVKGYIATQIELDRALELLINKLKEANKLDDTVFVLLADHYPYNLTVSEINELSSYERDSLIEVNSNNLIIYNSKMKKVTVDKVGMSIDTIPTVFNLFGIPYDSRVIMGKDILSTTEGIAIFNNRSWVTNKGTYYASTGRFDGKSDDIPEGYVDRINAIVGNRVAISRMIVSENYYSKIFK